MRFLPSCGNVSTIVWMHHLNANEIHEEKARRKLYKNAIWCFETAPSRNGSCKATYLSSHKLSKSDKQDILGTADEAETNCCGHLPRHMPVLADNQRLTYISSIRTLDAV